MDGVYRFKRLCLGLGWRELKARARAVANVRLLILGVGFNKHIQFLVRC
jgi:hypothetical protein